MAAIVGRGNVSNRANSDELIAASPSAPVRAPDVVDVGAGDERRLPGAGDDEHADVRVRGQFVERPVTLPHGLEVERVPDRGTIDRQRGDRLGDVDSDIHSADSRLSFFTENEENLTREWEKGEDNISIRTRRGRPSGPVVRP